VTLVGDGQPVRSSFPIGTKGRSIQRRYRNAELDKNFELEGEVLYFTTRGLEP
jgi:hypothetical protein